MAQTLLILGQRTLLTEDAVISYPRRIVALDPVSLLPVVANWQYENDSNIVQGEAFYDTNPARRLTASAEGYSSVMLNASNINLITGFCACAITDDQTVFQWSDNSFTTQYPLDVTQNHNTRQISTGYQCAFALRDDNSLWAWGSPEYGGELKISTQSRTDIISTQGPTGAGLLLGASAPYVDSWGTNSVGIYQVPDLIASMNDIAMLATQDDARAVLNTQGQVFAWGIENYGGLVPDDIRALTDIVSLTANFYSFCGLRSTGAVVAWGQVQNGGTVPAEIAALTDIVRVFPGFASYIALRANGSIVAWGASYDFITIPPEIAALTNIVDVRYVPGASEGSWVALCADGTVVAWGSSQTGVVQVPTDLSGVVALMEASDYILALKNDGTVVKWGNNALLDVDVSSQLTGVRALYAAANVAVALKDDGTVFTWGDTQCGGDASGIPAEVQGHVSYSVAQA